MDNNSPYLFDAPAQRASDIKVNTDAIDDLLMSPVTGADVAYRVNKAQMEGENPNLSLDEFKLYDEWHKKQEVEWFKMASDGVGTFFSDVGSGLASLQPFGEKNSTKEALLNIGPRSIPTAVEALGRGTRDLGGLFYQAAKNQNSPLYRLFNPNGDTYERYLDFNDLAEFNAKSTRIMEGKENVALPNDLAEHASRLVGEDVSTMTPQNLWRVNNRLAHAGSYFLDPATIATLGSSALAKAGGKTLLTSSANAIAKAGIKEGITGAASAARNTATKLEVSGMRGAGLVETMGKSMRVAGEVVDTPISRSLEWMKRQASEFLDTNIHDTPSANIKVTGATKGQGGFGGAVMAGLGYASWSIPYAAGIVPIWAVANAAKIGGGFLEAVGKEMVHGGGILQRLGVQQTSTGKLARTFNKWSPLGSYVAELSKATLKSGAYGAGIGYLSAGEEGAASGLGVGAAIGTSHYHYGVAHNMFKGNSREAMMRDLIQNVEDYRRNGFTQKADAILKYLNDLKVQHGDDGFYRNLSAYLAIERDSEIALSVWHKEDFLRIKNDPTTPDDVRAAIEEVVSQNDPSNAGQGWNGLFWGRRGSKPYFLYKDSKSAKTHIILNAWAVDADTKVQSTGLKGEFYHVLADAWKEASGKEKFKEEIFDGLSRTLSVSETPEGRQKMSAILRNAAGRLGQLTQGVNNQPSANSRTNNLLRLARKTSPAGWNVDHVLGNVTVVEKGVNRPLYSWQAKNGWRVTETSDGKYVLSGSVEGKRVRYEATTLSEAVLKHREIAPMDLQTTASTAGIEPRRKKAKITPIGQQVETTAGTRIGDTQEGQARLARASNEKVIDGILRFMSEKEGYDFALESKKNPDKAKYQRDLVKRFLADGWIHDESRVVTKITADSTLAEFGWFHPEYPNLTIEEAYKGGFGETPTATQTAGTPPPNVSGERTDVNAPKPPQQAKPNQTSNPVHSPETVESIHDAIDHFEKTGELRGNDLSILIEEMGEAIWDAHEKDQPFDYIYLAGDLGFARNLIDELKHRFARITDRNARQAGFVPDFNKPFVKWFEDKDGKAIVDPYMRKLFKQFLEVHQNRKSNFTHYNVDIASMSPAMQKHFIEENGIEDMFDKDAQTGNYVKKSEEQINKEQHQRYQAAVLDLIELERGGIDTGMHMYAIEKDAPETGSLDEENAGGTLRQQAWQQYRTTVDDITQAQKRGSMPTKEELEQMLKRRNMGKRNRPRTGEIDDLVASAKKGTIVFSGVPTVEAFRILQKHLPLREIEAIAQIAPVILEGGITKPNVVRVKYAGFEHAPETGPKLKKPKDNWSATEKNMVFYGIELRSTLRNIKTGKFDYKRPHAHFLLHGIDMDVLQRRIQWMWKNERETSKRWENFVEFEKDVYRLIENYSMKSAIGGNRFFGGGAEGKAKKRLACAAIGAFPSKSMLGHLDGEDVDFDVPEIDWHHYQLRSYGKGNAGRDIPWTALRADGIRNIYGTMDAMRMPYAERAYYRAQEMYQPAVRKAVRDGDDVPATMRYVSQELQTGRANQIFGRKTSGGHMIPDYTPSGVIRAIVDGQFKMSPEKDKNVLEFVKGGVGHDEATNSALVFWHFSNTGNPFEKIEQGQIGLHIGTREASMYRASNIARDTGVTPASIAENTFPLVVNIKKPITLLDRGAWSPNDIVDTILYAHRPLRERMYGTQPKVESFYDRGLLDEIVKTTGPLSSSDIKFLEDYRAKLASEGINSVTAFSAQADMSINKGVTPSFTSTSKKIYNASVPLHQWFKSKGIDAIRYRNSVEGGSISYIVFDGRNAKNMLRNSGEFSRQSISMFRQQAATFGAKTYEQRKALEANYNQSAREGDIFLASSIKDNFLGSMPPHTAVIRQMADEAHEQGVSLDNYNAQFRTGAPVVFPAVHATDSYVVAKEGAFDPKSTLSQGRGVWWVSHTEVAKWFKKEMPRDYIARALIKTQNPLVVDAGGMRYDNKSLSVPTWIKKAKADGHDALILTNIADDVSLSTGEPVIHNQIVVFNEFANDNIAVIDNDITSQRPVPRGLGINVGEAPLRQEAAKDVKRTFYSAVEKFVEERVTDKTSLNELMGLLDPTKGTGIVKSELEFLDIAGWIEEQKKANGGTKAKVNKQALLDYIKAHKFELQEDKTNKAWYTLQGLDPNSPQVQSQIEGGYEGFTPANKGLDDLHPTTNYRVLILRGPTDADFSGGEGGHFENAKNIIAFARVGDIYLDRETEVPSPLTTTPLNKKSLVNKILLPDNVNEPNSLLVQRSRLETKLNYFFISLLIDEKQFETLTIEEKVKQLYSTSDASMRDQRTFTDGTPSPSQDVIGSFGDLFDRISSLSRVHSRTIAEGFKKIIEDNFIRPSGTPDQHGRYIPSDIYDDRIGRIDDEIASSQMGAKRKRVSQENTYLLVMDSIAPSGKYTPMDPKNGQSRETAFGMMFELLDSLMQKEEPLEIVDEMASKKKMLIIFETQSDTAQKMQFRNDNKTEHILTQQQLEEKNRLTDELNDIQHEISMATMRIQLETKDYARLFDIEKEFPDLYAKRQAIKDKLEPLQGKEHKPIISEREFEKIPEVKAELEKRMATFDGWVNWSKSKRNRESGVPLDDLFEEGTSKVTDMIGGDNPLADVLSDNTIGGRQNFVDNINVVINRIIEASNLRMENHNEHLLSPLAIEKLEEIKAYIYKTGNITADYLHILKDTEAASYHDRTRLPYYDYNYFLGLISDIIYEKKEGQTRKSVKRIGRIIHEEITKQVIKEVFDTSVSQGKGFAFGAFKTDDFSKGNLHSIIDKVVDEYFEGNITEVTRGGEFGRKIWEAWEEYAMKDKNSFAYKQFREKVLHMLYDQMDMYERQSPNQSLTKEQTKTAQLQNIASLRKTVVTEYMPFLRTEDFSKLMFKKLLREAVDNGYEGIIIIPPELPKIITGGESQYFYGTIFPKVINNYSKRFGSKLRQNKSLTLTRKVSEQTDHMAYILTLATNGYSVANKSPSFRDSVNRLQDRAQFVINATKNPELYNKNYDHFVNGIVKESNLSIENARLVMDYFIQKAKNSLSEDNKAVNLDLNKDEFNATSVFGNPSESASQRGLILDITPQMDAIKEGQPLWQPAARKPKKTSPSGEPAPETVADVRGESAPPIAKPQDRTIGEREAGSSIPEIGNRGIVDSYGTDLDQRLVKDGVADYRGYKIIYDKANGGYKIMDPAGKAVMYPVAYVDKITGERVVKNTRHVVFPYEAAEYVDHLLGGMPEKKPVATPALPKPASVASPAMVRQPEPVSKPAQAGGRPELEIVQSQLKNTGKAKYYLYNIEFDAKTNTYSAKDNSGQPVQMMFPSTFQSGPRVLQSTRNASLQLVLEGLDKQFDKNKWARLAPRDAEVKPPAPASVATVEPTTPPVIEPVSTPAVQPKPAPTRRVEASSVPPAVREAKPTKPVKPKRQLTPTTNVNTAEPQVKPTQPVQVVPPTLEVKPAVIEATADAWEIKNKQNEGKPNIVLSDRELMERQAKALGVGFIEMMKDPELADVIINSLNIDDNLTLKGDTDNASTEDGRFSVSRKGKKYVITQNNYKSPITGIEYNKKLVAYVNTIHQAQALIRRLELERNWTLASNRMPIENPLAVRAQTNPAYVEPSRMKAIRDNAMIQMLMSMRDQGITPIHIDPVTLEPLLVMLPSQSVITEVTKPSKPIAGMLPQTSTTERGFPLAIMDQASIFRAIDDVVIKGLSQKTREEASRFRNALGYEIIKFKGKFRLFNPMKGSISVRDDVENSMDDIIRDIHKNGLNR
jgi:hypothetical protein